MDICMNPARTTGMALRSRRLHIWGLAVLTVALCAPMVRAGDSPWQKMLNEQKKDNRRWESDAKKKQSDYYKSGLDMVKRQQYDKAAELFRKAMSITYPRWKIRTVRRTIRKEGEGETEEMPATQKTTARLRTRVNGQARKQLDKLEEKEESEGVTSAYKEAKKLESEKHYAEAYERYRKIAAADLPFKLRKKYGEQSAKAAGKIIDDAETKLRQIASLAEQQEGDKVLAGMLEFQEHYAGLESHPRLKTRYALVASLPEIARELRNQHASKQLALAHARMNDGRLGAACDLLRIIAEQYMDTPAGKEASAELRKIDADKVLSQALREQRAEKDSVIKLNLARNFAANGLHERAAEIYREIIRAYPDTRFAEKAQAELAKLKEKGAGDAN